ITSLEELKKFNLEWPTIPKALQEGLYTYKYEGFEYDFLYKPSQEKRLFVLLSGSANRSKFTPPVFQRWSWAEYFPGHCL
ncbi:hypothetical protein, partial [Pseudomonas sp. 2822-17]|uniref:hypothetical protein n=1 Tax=Pseudomonas sp. 2822-17 TaxID=1712678 RepID=UPI001C4547CB